MKGRPRKPTAEKRLTGRSPGKDSAGRKLPPEPKYGALPKPPTNLKSEGLREWKRLAPVMVEQGVLSEADWLVFLQYCNCVTKRFAIQRSMDKEKIGSDEWHKLDRAFDRNEKQLSKAITELGLSPVTRSKVALKEKSAKDPAEKFKRAKLVAFKGGKK